jgi:uncharacterized protein YggE
MARKGWQWTSVVLAAAVLGWFGFGSNGGEIAKAEPVAATGVSAMNTITVGASGTVKVEPDVAYVNVAVETRGATAGEAQKTNANKFAAVEKALTDQFGVDKKDLQTSGFFVQAEYNYNDKDGRKLIGYIAVHSVQVKFRKLGEIGKLLDAVSSAGANRIDGVQFGTEKTEQYELEALKKAMVQAEAKANVLAQSAKRQVKGVVNIVQGAAAAPPVLYMSDMQAKTMSAAGESPTSVQTGQIEISVNVTVQYQM